MNRAADRAQVLCERRIRLAAANGGPNRDALSCELAAQRKQVALRPPDFALRNDLQDPHSL